MYIIPSFIAKVQCMWLREFKAVEGVLCVLGAILEYVNYKIVMREHTYTLLVQIQLLIVSIHFTCPWHHVSLVTQLAMWHLSHMRVLYTTCGTCLQH